jgi:hypothetical protein
MLKTKSAYMPHVVAAFAMVIGLFALGAAPASAQPTPPPKSPLPMITPPPVTPKAMPRATETPLPPGPTPPLNAQATPKPYNPTPLSAPSPEVLAAQADKASAAGSGVAASQRSTSQFWLIGLVGVAVAGLGLVVWRCRKWIKDRLKSS